MPQLEQFIFKLDAKGIKVVVSTSKKQKQEIARKFGRNPERLIDAFVEFERQTGINRFSFVLEPARSKAWKKKGQPWAVINFNKISTKKDEFGATLNGLAERITCGEEGPSISKVKPSKVAPKKVSVGDWLLELRSGIKILVPNAKDLGIEAGGGENFLRLLRGEDWLFIYCWEERGLPEITIAGKDYRLKENTIVELQDEFEFVNGRIINKEKQGREFPLIRRKDGEKIILLNEIRGNEELDKLLSPFSFSGPSKKEEPNTVSRATV